MRIEELINTHYDKLNQNDLHIWKYIVYNKEKCCDLTIDELATKCNVSRTTILKFAQKLSLKGYSELKVYLKWEINSKEKVDTHSINRMCDDYKKIIEDLRKKEFEQVCKMIYEAERVFVYGTGSVQNSVANELKRMFLTGEKCFYLINGVSETERLLDIITPKDLIIVISLTGSSIYVKHFAKELNLKSIPIISITKLKNNELATFSTCNLYITTSLVNIGNKIPYEATGLFFLLTEILFVKYLNYKEKRRQAEGKYLSNNKEIDEIVINSKV